MKTIKFLIKIILFILIFLFLFNSISRVLISAGLEDIQTYQFINGIYKEEENSLDAVYIGSSNCYTFWNPIVAWKNYGITTYSYASNYQSIAFTKYLIKEARKTQPNALFIVNINNIIEIINERNIHFLTDFMPFSINKIELINYVCDLADYNLEKRLEFYFPIIKHHNRWNYIEKEDLYLEYNGYKGADVYVNYLTEVEDINYGYFTSNGRKQIPKLIITLIDDLMDFCDEENINILFVTVPRAEGSKEHVEVLNSLNDRIAARGYPILDLMDKTGEIGISKEKDYFDKHHLNIKGSIKFTEYFSQYLIDTYSFKDKRKDDKYSSWNTAVKEYEEYIKQYVSDIVL